MGTGLFSNNAPPPIPGGFGNPTGTNSFKFSNPGASAGGGSGLPTTGSPIPQTTPQANNGVYSATNIQGLSSAFSTSNSTLGGNLYREFDRAYGKGTGDLLSQIFGKGLFNPQVASAFLNALQPGIQRGQADILNAFGAEGARFGSTAAIGLGDFNSQVQLNEQQTLASLYEQAQSNELGLLQNILPTLHTEEANQGSGILSDILHGLEIAGGVALEFVPGGQVLGTGLITSGISGFAGGGKGGSSGSSNPVSADSVTQLVNAIKAKNSSTNIGAPGQSTGIGSGTGIPTPDVIPSASAAANLGGADPFQSSDSSGDSESQSFLKYLVSQGLLDPNTNAFALGGQ